MGSIREGGRRTAWSVPVVGAGACSRCSWQPMQLVVSPGITDRKLCIRWTELFFSSRATKKTWTVINHFYFPNGICVSHDGRSVLIDWTFEPTLIENEMALLEALVGRLLAMADRGLLRLTIYDGSGAGCYYGKNARRRFWRRRMPLPQALGAASPE